uniref:Putative secreted protein n=1 Tax=Anopheles marajoara TaxID=58244 RepID=A0A2M4C6C7_9DIPT
MPLVAAHMLLIPALSSFFPSLLVFNDTMGAAYEATSSPPSSQRLRAFPKTSHKLDMICSQFLINNKKEKFMDENSGIDRGAPSVQCTQHQQHKAGHDIIDNVAPPSPHSMTCRRRTTRERGGGREGDHGPHQNQNFASLFHRQN